MADLIAPNSNDPQEIAKQVEAIAEAAAQHNEQVAQLLNLVPKAAALSTVASRAISFTKKNWVDTPTSGTPITAADMNRLEQAIVDLNTTLTSVQNSLSHTLAHRQYLANSGDLNDVTGTGVYVVSNDSGGISNMPDGAYDWGVMIVASYNGEFLLQLLVTHMRASSGAAFARVSYGGSWGQWSAL